mmetsp:Transcript_37029/g.66649  ORF Transcript_37029/g.66649 Transcript_37029/m.66649 type:complete len:245 (-) Transcript_37029:300-1034(-)
MRGALNNGRSVFGWLQSRFGSMFLHRIFHRPDRCRILSWFCEYGNLRNLFRIMLHTDIRLSSILHDNIHLFNIFITSTFAIIADFHSFLHGMFRSPLRLPLLLRLGQIMSQPLLELGLPPRSTQLFLPQLLSQVINNHAIDIEFVVWMRWHCRGSCLLRWNCLRFLRRLRCRLLVQLCDWMIWNGIFLLNRRIIRFRRPQLFRDGNAGEPFPFAFQALKVQGMRPQSSLIKTTDIVFLPLLLFI